MKAFAVRTLAVCLAVLSAPVVGCAAGAGGSGTQTAPPDIEMLYQEALHLEEGQGDLQKAIEAYKRVVEEHERSAALAAKAQHHIARAFERLGKKDDAIAAYRELLRRFSASREAAAAAERLEALGAGAPAEPRATGVSQRELEKREIDKKLQKRLPHFNFSNTTLDAIFQILRDFGQVNIVVDARVDVTGLKANIALTNISIADVLSHVTRSFGLDWTIWKNAVYISDAGTIEELEKEARFEGLEEEEVAILDKTIAILEGNMQNAKMMMAKGAASGEAVAQAQLRLLEVQLERARALKGERETRRAEAPAPERPPRQADVAAPEPAGWPGAKEAALYNVQLKNFTGPQLLDLDADRSAAAVGAGTECFAGRGDFDLAFASGKIKTRYGNPDSQYEAALITNSSCRAVFVPQETTLQNLPRMIDYPEAVERDVYLRMRTGTLEVPWQRAVEVKDLPFILQTTEGEYLVKAQGAGDEKVRVFYERISGRGSGISAETGDPGIARLDARIEALMHEYEQLKVRFARGQQSRESTLHHLVRLLGTRLERNSLVAQREKEPEKAAKIEKERAALEAAVEQARSYIERIDEAQRTRGGVRLYTTGIPNFVGPQVLDIDTGRTTHVPQGMSATEFLARNTEFDLAYAGPYAVIANHAIKAAVISRHVTPDRLPREIDYPEPRKAEGNVEYDAEGRLVAVTQPVITDQSGRPTRLPRQPAAGVFRDESDYVILVRGPLVLRTDKGEYLLDGISGDLETVNINYQKLPPREPLPELPPLEFE